MTLPLHLVDNRIFTMGLNGLNVNPKTGEDFAFIIKGPSGETFGTEILSPIYRVDLTDPSGAVRTLTNITDWYEIGDMLHICGTNTDGEVITSEGGVYTITAYANGYQTMAKRVEITGNGSGFSTRGMTFNSYDIDGVSRATSGSGGSSGDGGSSGGGSVNAFLMFDHDLLANALLLHELGITNEDADAVITQWGSQNPVSVMDENAEVLYDFTHYVNTIKDARLEQGQSLSFQTYVETQTGGVTENRPYQAKRVLEDGLLGATFRFTETIGKPAPRLEYTEEMLGKNMVLSCSGDDAYIGAIKELYLDGGGVALRDDDYISQYEMSEDKCSITLYSQTGGTSGGQVQLSAGTHTLRIVAEGYQAATITFQVKKTLEEFNLSLNPNPTAEGADDPLTYYTNQEVSIQAAASESEEVQSDLRGDFMAHMTRISLTYPDGNTKDITSEREGQIGGDDNYVKESFSFILQKGLFKAAGRYVVTVYSEGYTPKLLHFDMEETIETPENPETPEGNKKTPEFKEVQLREPMFGKTHYQISFHGLGEDELAAYLGNEEIMITVNGIEYTKAFSISWADEYQYTVENDDQTGGGYKYLLLTTEGFAETSNAVIVEVEGYEPLSFSVKGAGSEPENPEIPEEGEDGETMLPTPKMKSVTFIADFMGNPYYRVSFEGLSEEALITYLEQDNKVMTVNGMEYQETRMSFWNDIESYKVSADETYGIIKFLDFTPDGYTELENIVRIEVKGYQTLEFVVKTSKSNVLEAEEIPSEDDLEVPEAELSEKQDAENTAEAEDPDMVNPNMQEDVVKDE